jgi:hypothetical protein
MLEFEKLCQNPTTSSYHHRIPAVLCQIGQDPRPSGRDPGRIRPFWPGSSLNGRILDQSGRDPAEFGRYGWDPPRTAGQDLSHLARTTGFRPVGWDSAVLCQIPATFARIHMRQI